MPRKVVERTFIHDEQQAKMNESRDFSTNLWTSAPPFVRLLDGAAYPSSSLYKQLMQLLVYKVEAALVVKQFRLNNLVKC